MLRHRSIRLLLSLLASLAAALPAAAQAPAPPAAFAGYELVEASYLLRAPDGSLLRVVRTPPAAGAQGLLPGGSASWPPAGLDAPPRARALAVSSWGDWLGGWLFRAPRIYTQMSDYVRESWALFLRLLDFLGVLVLLAGSWVIWFMVRPMLLGVPDRVAFLLAFALVSALWLYATGLTQSVIYALGLMLLPALVLGSAAWLVRRGWSALRGPGEGSPAP